MTIIVDLDPIEIDMSTDEIVDMLSDDAARSDIEAAIDEAIDNEIERRIPSRRTHGVSALVDRVEQILAERRDHVDEKETP